MELLAQRPKSEKPDGRKDEKVQSRVFDISLLRLPEIVKRDGRYVAYGNGIICDCYTKMEWLGGADRDTSWYEASAWVETLNAGAALWSLPTLEQLRDLYRKNIRKERLSPLFPMEPTDVWSCELKDESSAWAFNFIPGNSFWTYCTFSRRFRALAVRPKPDYGSYGR